MKIQTQISWVGHSTSLILDSSSSSYSSKYPGQCDSLSRPWRHYGSTSLCYIFHFFRCWRIDDNLVGQLTTIMEPPWSFPTTHLSRNTNSPDSCSFLKSAWAHVYVCVLLLRPSKFYGLEIIIAKKVAEVSWNLLISLTHPRQCDSRGDSDGCLLLLHPLL